MDNIEKVVRERNQAYHLLETGVDGERPARMERDIIGMKFLYQYENDLKLFHCVNCQNNV